MSRWMAGGLTAARTTSWRDLRAVSICSRIRPMSAPVGNPAITHSATISKGLRVMSSPEVYGNQLGFRMYRRLLRPLRGVAMTDPSPYPLPRESNHLHCQDAVAVASV